MLGQAFDWSLGNPSDDTYTLDAGSGYGSDWLWDSTQPASTNSSVVENPTSPTDWLSSAIDPLAKLGSVFSTAWGAIAATDQANREFAANQAAMERAEALRLQQLQFSQGMQSKAFDLQAQLATRPTVVGNVLPAQVWWIAGLGIGGWLLFKMVKQG